MRDLTVGFQEAHPVIPAVFSIGPSKTGQFSSSSRSIYAFNSLKIGLDGIKIIDLDRAGNTPLYLQIKEHIANLVEKSLLLPGSRLPATRELAGSLEVSRNTVVEAYQELEVSGLIISRVGRGAFVCRHLPPGISPRKSGAKPTMSYEGLLSTSWLRPCRTGIYSRFWSSGIASSPP